MNTIAIQVKSLSKKYQISAIHQNYYTLRDTISEALKNPFRFLHRKKVEESSSQKIWALEDVSFEIKYGEVVGVIGNNGAGKSTLLKILARIVEPTDGYADIYGRVAALLEVGAGFHQELSGRENIYLNGSILGMKKKEIDQKFDRIVEFSEIEKFIDTAVKYYSSGMYLRLAFSIAAHLEPEILLMDEILAVGDLNFQKKCLAKMESVAQQGCTILMISHNLSAVRQFCKQVLWLDHGHLVLQGETNTVIDQYLKSLNQLKQKT